MLSSTNHIENAWNWMEMGWVLLFYIILPNVHQLPINKYIIEIGLSSKYLVNFKKPSSKHLNGFHMFIYFLHVFSSEEINFHHPHGVFGISVGPQSHLPWYRASQKQSRELQWPGGFAVEDGTPLKVGNPQRKVVLRTPTIHFQGRTVKFQGM